MQVSVEELDGLERRMTVEVPAQEVEQEVRSRLTSLARKVRLDGFRPGKVPLKFVKRMYGRQVHEEVVGELIQSSFEDALSQQELRPVGTPKVERKKIEAGDNLEYSAIFEVFPKFEVTGIDNLKVERPIAEVTENDIDNMLETLRKQRIIWNDVEHGAENGNRITVTFEGTIDGEGFPGDKGEEVHIVLGEGTASKEFEDALMGLQTDSEAEFDITFPENHRVKEIAGKTAHFVTKVDAVAEPELPEINEEFAVSFGIKEGGVDGLRSTLRTNMERELNMAVKSNIKKQIARGLLEANDILVPRIIVNSEIERLAQQVGLPVGKEVSEEIAEAKTKIFEEEAKRRVALGFIISRIVEANDIQLDNAYLNAELEAIASAYEDSAEATRAYQQDPRLLESAKSSALENQVFDWLLEHAEVTDRPSSFDDATQTDRSENTVFKEPQT